MFYLLYGKDTYRSKEKLKELVLHFQTKISSSGFFRIDENNFSENDFEELLKTKNLFDKKNIVIVDGVMGDKNFNNFIFDKLEQCAKSDNIFLFLEEEMEDKVLGKVEKFATKIQQFDLLEGAKLNAWFADQKIPSTVATKIIAKCGSDLWRASKEIEKYQLGGQFEDGKKQGEYNPFAICDAFAEKNKIKTWTLFQQALMAGIPAEEVFFKLLWQIKNLLLVKKLSEAGTADVAKESGLKPFVANKAIKAAKIFSEEELKNYSCNMLKIYHEERRSGGEMAIELEKILIA